MGCMQSTPVNEPVAAAPASNKSVAEAPASQASAAPAPVSSGALEPELEAAPASQEKKYIVSGVSITDQGVVFYQIDSADGSLSIKRRFNDFKAIYAQLDDVSSLPALPEAGLKTRFGARHSQELLKSRELQFGKILNAIAGTPALAESGAFQTFISA